MNLIIEKIKNKQSGILLYGLTPPKANNSVEKIQTISERRISRLHDVNIDGLIFYDIQDEHSRNTDERPFPFLPTIDPIEYKTKYFKNFDVPTIFYQCVGKYSPDEIESRLKKLKEECTVFVGSSSKNENTKCSIKQAYEIFENNRDSFLGGVTIPERHVKYSDEHLRLVKKQNYGVQFFISQFIFNIEKVKNLISEYYYYCRTNNIEMVPIFFTVTPCGSMKTLELLKWLGVSIPDWIKNELMNSINTLELSIELCMNAIADISHFCMAKRIPFGCNVESVSIKKEEVLALFELLKMIEDKFISLGIR